MTEKSLEERKVKALESIAKSLEKPLLTSLTDDRGKDEWGYPRRYSESGW